MLNLRRIALPAFILITLYLPVFSQEANYDESKVPAYTLPDPLITSKGKKVTEPRAWQNRREEIVNLFRHHVYGVSPGRPRDMRFEVRSVDKNALNGMATRKEVRV